MGTEETTKEESAPVRRVRVVNETPDSNPQLAENLPLLSRALHLDIELVEQEAWIGRYEGDIHAEGRKSDAAIVIEHRSDETYQYQLGEFLTYAEDYDARILIWIVDNCREEHRSALDWLNRCTPEDTEVFGVEVRSTVEGDADANPQFVPVVAPASWPENGEGEQLPKIRAVVLREFFQALVADLSSKGFMDNQQVVTKYDQSFPSGLSEVDFHASFEADGSAWVYIPGWPPGNNRILNEIRNDAGKKEKIEDELKLSSGTLIKWKTGANSTGVYRKASLNDSQEELDEIRRWMFEYLLKFKKVFKPRLEAIIARMNDGG